MKENLAEDYASGNKEYWENQRRSYGITYRGEKAAGDYELRIDVYKRQGIYCKRKSRSDFSCYP